MKDTECVDFLQWALPRLRMRWPGFRKVRRQVGRRIDRRRQQLGLDSVRQYRDYLENHEDEWQVLDEFCRITISRFYRDRGVFDFLRDNVFPQVAASARKRGDKVASCWCAGCASGEEVYTIKLLWERYVHPAYPDVQLHIVATDADPLMLSRARRAIYRTSSLKDCPQDWLRDVFIRTQDNYRLVDAYRDGIDWRAQDLRREMPVGPFQIIFCRHLAFTYFDQRLQTSIREQLIDRLAPVGFLVTGKQESLPAGPRPLDIFGQNMGIYRKQDAVADSDQDAAGATPSTRELGAITADPPGGPTGMGSI